jgi:hypothetical protein
LAIAIELRLLNGVVSPRHSDVRERISLLGFHVLPMLTRFIREFDIVRVGRGTTSLTLVRVTAADSLNKGLVEGPAKVRGTVGTCRVFGQRKTDHALYSL